MSILAQIIGLACLLFWGSGFAASCGCPPGLPAVRAVLLHGSAAAGWQLQPALAGAQLLLVGLCSPWRSAAVTKFCPSCSPRVCWPFAALLGC